MRIGSATTRWLIERSTRRQNNGDIWDGRVIKMRGIIIQRGAI